MTPEELARQVIDAQLIATGWVVQNRNELNLAAGHGIALREAPMANGAADYLLLVGGKAVGVIEAKAAGAVLVNAEAQAEGYCTGLKYPFRAWRPEQPLPIYYLSTGEESFFVNLLDPAPRSRRVFTFHPPASLLALVHETQSLRARLQQLPPLASGALWAVQQQTITRLEESLAENRPRALVQMATGAGKTFTAVNSVYRLIRYANVRRVLFLVDRTNLGRQALGEFQTFVTPDDGRKFTELYGAQLLGPAGIDPAGNVVIATIQRLYSLLAGEPLAEELEEQSAFEQETGGERVRTVRYNPTFPIDTFDLIVIDECHRSIYNVWRQVLDYFDAFLVGLTATPSRQTIGFFNENLVMEYTHREAVADGINVPGDIYRIRTEVSERGAVVAKGEFVGRRNRVTRALLQAALDDELAYQASQVGDDIITPSQIRTVIRTYKERVFTDLFPERQSSDGTPAILPKTLIFARNDNHAQEIVAIVREEFAEGNAFCRKITYRAEDGLPSELLNHFRNSFFPRVAVTVDMIATGTDIKTLEVLIFLRTVRSLGYFEQMRGRGTRVVKLDELQQATPNARIKDRFVLVDAVGVTDSPLVEVTPPLERKRTVSLAALLDEAAAGNCDEALVATLAGRLAKVASRLTTEQHYDIAAVTGGPLAALLAQMEQALEPDAARQSAAAGLGKAEAAVSAAEQAAAAATLREAAMRPFHEPALRRLLQEFSGKGDIIIDGVTLDVLTMADYSSEGAHGYIRSFREYIEQHKDEIAALRLLYSQPYGAPITFAQIKELGLQLQQPPHALTTERLWKAYAQVEKDRVRGANRQRTLTDIVALVRHAIGHDEDGVLEPFPEQVQRRYERWLADQQADGLRFRPQQRAWLDEIARYMGVNLRVTAETLRQSPFTNRGGAWAFREEFGDQWEWVLAELNEKLI